MAAVPRHPQRPFACRNRGAPARPAGFTLPEVLLALAVVSVVAVMAMPESLEAAGLGGRALDGRFVGLAEDFDP